MCLGRCLINSQTFKSSSNSTTSSVVQKNLSIRRILDAVLILRTCGHLHFLLSDLVHGLLTVDLLQLIRKTIMNDNQQLRRILLKIGYTRIHRCTIKIYVDVIKQICIERSISTLVRF